MTTPRNRNSRSSYRPVCRRPTGNHAFSRTMSCSDVTKQTSWNIRAACLITTPVSDLTAPLLSLPWIYLLFDYVNPSVNVSECLQTLLHCSVSRFRDKANYEIVPKFRMHGSKCPVNARPPRCIAIFRSKATVNMLSSLNIQRWVCAPYAGVSWPD